MRIVDCAQGSPEWHAARLGIPTASEFGKIITPATGKLSKQSRAYAFRLAAEKLLNRSLTDDVKSQWMARGTEMEPGAVKAYVFQEGIPASDAIEVGFITTDDGRIGASPDRLIGEDGLLEVKCGAPNTHLAYLIDGFGTDYRPQVMGQLLVSERDWCTRLAFYPEMPLVIDRQYRDESYIKLLRAALDEFLDELDAITEKAKSLGVIEAARIVLTPEEQADRARGPRTPFWHTIVNPFDDPETTLWSG